MSKQTVYGGRFHGAAIQEARCVHCCAGCGCLIHMRRLHISYKLGRNAMSQQWVYEKYCGHCDASTPEGRQSVAAVAKAREAA